MESTHTAALVGFLIGIVVGGGIMFAAMTYSIRQIRKKYDVIIGYTGRTDGTEVPPTKTNPLHPDYEIPSYMRRQAD